MNANELLVDATIEQRKWVIARLSCKSDAEAGRVVGIHPTTIARWPNKDKLSAAVVALLAEPLAAAQATLADALLDAARIKVEGLKARRDEVKQAVASEIMDRVMGKATQRTEVSGPDGGPVESVARVIFEETERWRSGSDDLPSADPAPGPEDRL